MEDLEKAILITYDPSSSADPSLRTQAMSFLSQIRSQTPPPTLLRISLDLLHRSGAIPIQFWSLQTLHDVIFHSYSSLSEDLPILRSSLMALSLSPSPSSPPFLKNKLAQTLACLIRLEYPSLFPNPFIDLTNAASSSAGVVDFLSRLLSALDDDLISQDYPRSAEESAAATRVKDAMRAQCVPQLVSFFYDSVVLYRSSEPALAAAVLDSMRKYVAWIDIGLVAHDAFLGLLFNLVESQESENLLKSAAGRCLLAVVSKRMDFRAKLALLRRLKPKMGRLFVSPGLVSCVGGLITGFAAEALECYKKLGSSTEAMELLVEATTEAMELLEEALPSLFYVMKDSEELDLGDVVSFLSDYVLTMKSSPSQKQLVYLGQILELIRMKIQYDPDYRSNLDLPDKIGKEEEDLVAEHRKDLFTLFRGVCRAAPEAVRLFIRNLIANALSSSNTNVEEVEAALSLFYQLGETVSEEDMKSGSGLLGELVTMLLSARFSCHSHRLVALVYLETITRYMKFVQENTQYIPNVLAAFLDERGIHHPNINVSRRASYLFMRAVKLLKARLVPFIDTILQNLQDTVARFTSLDWPVKEMKCSGSEDGSHTFEAIGLMIGSEDVSPEKQSEYLTALLKPLCQQVESLLFEARLHGLEESSPRVLRFQQLIMALNALSKGFSERLVTTSRPAIGTMFKQTLDVLLQILVTFPTIKPLRNRVTSYLHRMVEILGVSVFPYLPIALNQLLVESEPKDMVDFLILINQVICKFSTSVGGMLEELFPTIASKLFNVLSSDAFSSGPGSNTEEIRELRELQKALYTFLHVMATHDLSYIFLAQNSRGYLDATMQLLLIAACSHKDVVVRKMCVQIFIRLMKDWCTKYSGEDKVPGFRTFLIEKFASNCCLISVLDKSFDLRDANTLVLFGEIVMVQKLMYEKFGDAFLLHSGSKPLISSHCPQKLADKYYKNLQANDIKALKSTYQEVIEHLRQQPNGSLVFR